MAYYTLSNKWAQQTKDLFLYWFLNTGSSWFKNAFFPKQRPPGGMEIAREAGFQNSEPFSVVFLCTILKGSFLQQGWSVNVKTKRLWRITSEIKINCPFFFASSNRMSFCFSNRSLMCRTPRNTTLWDEMKSKYIEHIQNYYVKLYKLELPRLS